MSTLSGDSGNQLIPNMAGKAMTVKGPIEPDQLGTTLMHEHLFIDLRKSGAPNENVPATEAALWEQKLTLDNLHHARERKPIADNWLLSDEKMAIDEVNEFRNQGGNTIVEVTSIGIRRDPRAMLRVANATGLNVVMGTGWYQKIYHPANMDERTVEDLTEEIIRDLTVGVGDTGIRSGIIGEVGIEGQPIEPNEVKSIQASARASRATGAAISFHRGGVGREKLETIGILGEEGAKLTRVIFGNSDPIAGDMPLMLELLSHGVYIQFDLLGRLTVPLKWKTETDSLSEYYFSAGSAVVADAIPKLIDAGFGDRILLSHDVCTKIHLKRYGGTGYSFIVEKFLPYLQTAGVSREQIETIAVENPKRVLTFAEPMP